MQLKHLKTLLPQQDGAAKIAAMCWASNNAKFAVCNAERVIVLFDENGEKKDKFSTKPIDSKYGKKSYQVKGLAFSPDGTKLAIGQTDNILFVYKIGEGWSEKKVICNKFVLQSGVTCLDWSSEIGIVFGQADGKIRLASVTSNKSSTLYNTDVFVCSIAPSPDRKGFLSGHADGSIVRFFFPEHGSVEAQGKICTHPCPPYALVWSQNAIVAAGCDRRIISYNRDGRIMQQFDYSREEGEKEFMSAVASPSGQNIVLSSFDRFRILNWHQRRGAWEEGKVKVIQYLYTIPNMSWKPDGSRICAGTLCGSVEMFDCALKRALLDNKFETTYVGSNQVIVKSVSTDQKVVLRSENGLEITDIKVMGKERYATARTEETLLFGDMNTGRTSEIPWQSSGNEKFYFEFENVGMIFNAGELTLVEYGNNDILGSVRTEFMNPHLISVRLKERMHRKSDDCKRIAYLVDLKTICIVDLNFGVNIGQVMHDAKIDWLELNETGKKLLLRDKRFRLNLYDVESESKHTLLSYCSYVQWVPGSDVAVAQSRDNLCVWYNIEVPERVTMFPIKGDITDVVREDGITDVIVQEGTAQVAYTLDEGMIEFGTAMEDNDFGRAVEYLEMLDLGPDTEAMWRTLAIQALQNKQLHVAQRCYAAMGDISRARYLQETLRIAKQASKNIGGDGTQFYKVRARLAIMEKQFKDAERIYLEQNALDEAMEMYEIYHRYDEALELAEARNHPDLDGIKTKMMRHLAETGQQGKAGEIKEKEGDKLAAIDMYISSGMPGKAAKVLLENETYMDNRELVDTVGVALIKKEMFEKAGQLFEKVKDFPKAMECYRRGKIYAKAIELARHQSPEEVVKLEEEWGDLLVQQKQTDAALNHYIESGQTLKALEAAINARQWNKAVQIVEVVEDSEEAKTYYNQIAQHYAEVHEYERAERFFIEAGAANDAIQMYIRAKKWSDAYRLGNEFLDEENVNEMFLEKAKQLEQDGNLKEAEVVYLAVGEPNRAIAMYKDANQIEPMMKLVQAHHGEHVQDTHVHVASELEESGRYAEAEQHYVRAGEWKSAVNMYRAQDQWEDAYRVAKDNGGEVAQKQVAFLWARSLGGDSAVKLLQKYGYLADAIDYASENGNFDFAFELCRLGMKEKMPNVHLKYAQQLEEDGDMAQAETHFLKANHPKEAVLMYMHAGELDKAQALAEQHSPESIPDVYIGQARLAFTNEDYNTAESFLLRAKRPDIIVKSYKDLGMWTEALRVCKEYLPNLLPELQQEYEQVQLKSGAKGAESYIAQAKDWESQGEHARAIACYMKIDRDMTNDEELMINAWMRAGQLASKFLPEEQSQEVVKQIATLLMEQRRHSEAAELFLSVSLTRESVDSLVRGEEWAKAKKVAVQTNNEELEEYVDKQYKEHLKNKGDAAQLADVDAVSAIEVYLENKQWDKALETAQNSSEALLDKHLVQHALEKMEEGDVVEGVKMFEKYGASSNRQNFNVYKKMIDSVLTLRDTNSAKGYEIWGPTRNMMLSLTENLRTSEESFDPRYQEIFDRYLLISHYHALRAALTKISEKEPSMKLLSTKLSVSLLRHTDLVPADKAFYEAGLACKEQGGDYESMGFLFLNHYLDLVEAIEEQNADAVDYSEFTDTDIPSEIPLPEAMHLTSEVHEEVKEWVLAISVDRQIDPRLITDARNVWQACLDNPDGTQAHPCIVTGYPVLGQVKSFPNSDQVANREDWNKLIMAAKTVTCDELDDIQKFLSKWMKTNISLAL